LSPQTFFADYIIIFNVGFQAYTGDLSDILHHTIFIVFFFILFDLLDIQL